MTNKLLELTYWIDELLIVADATVCLSVCSWHRFVLCYKTIYAAHLVMPLHMALWVNAVLGRKMVSSLLIHPTTCYLSISVGTNKSLKLTFKDSLY